MTSPAPSTPRHDPVLQTLTDQLKKGLGSRLRGLWLFGSRARGDARESSDYDILILVDEKTPELREHILDVQVELLDHHDVLVATLLRTEDEWRQSQGFPLARNIAREAVRL
ncbi:DNA polymerase III subunit beta [Thiocapsa imhoffii]|uniref:DNA polymerase III subunit beta n=1 Tax=Thiocapsa imhoffii TaxID=382777 RepID=A0A9X0WM44_9GAMM|nr:nucleotidyltransferase domain-containing protein [Thiocapsa imhoffii]MBK1646815.1 DNA polymerase III subunit beta [Thiocapsa imhoffii]